jgi:hypothetical protein
MPDYARVAIKSLRSLSADERWLQARIAEDPTILGFENVIVVERERQMIGGGRLDLLLADVDAKIRYEVELMLGELDESHIIRTIEYWDIERRRYPNLTHYAVIVAENITSRFFNVISLLNKSVPLIAIQMSALDLDGKIGLTFTRVLDLTETFDDMDSDDAPKEQVTRDAWEIDGYRESLKVVDLFANVLKERGIQPRVTYTNGYVSIASTGTNFVWCKPRKNGGLCHLEFKVGEENMVQWRIRLTESDLGDITFGRQYVKFAISSATFARCCELLSDLIIFSEDRTRK